MHPLRRQRLAIVLFIVCGASAAVALAGYALRDNINLFYPPVEVAAGKAPVDKRIRVGGMVLDGSIQRQRGSLEVAFVVTDYQARIPVVYDGILPDLFAAGEGVVATGILRPDGVFQASEILAKHDENYMPPEVQAALQSRPDAAGGTSKSAGS